MSGVLVAGLVLRRTRSFFPRGGQHRHQYSLHLSTEGGPGRVGLRGCLFWADLLLARLIGQYCFAGWRLSSSVVSSSVTLPAGRRARGRSARRRPGAWESGGRHRTAGQYGNVPLGRQLVLLVSVTWQLELEQTRLSSDDRFCRLDLSRHRFAYSTRRLSTNTEHERTSCRPHTDHTHSYSQTTQAVTIN